MDIRNIIINKRSEINTIGQDYIDSIVFECIDNIDCLDIAIEGIGEKLYNMKNRVIDAIKKMWAKIKKWLSKLLHNLKIMLTPAQKLASKYKAEIIKIYKEKGDEITVNSPAFKMNDDGFEAFVDDTLKDMMQLALYANVSISKGEKMNPNDCMFVKNSLVIIDDRAYVNRGSIKEFIMPLILKEEESKQRKLSEAISLADFTSALEGKEQLKMMKQSSVDVDKHFKDFIDKIKNTDVIESLETGEKIQVDKDSMNILVKFAGAYNGVYAAAMDYYMSGFKQMNRMVMAVVKRVLKKTGDGEDEDSDE